MKIEPKKLPAPISARMPLNVGFLTLFLLVIGLGYWGVFTRISGAVVSAGTIQVETNRQVVQHPTGGVVTDIQARNGDYVRAGQTLVRLEDAQQRSELSAVEGQLFEIRARAARLEAERDDLPGVSFPADLVVAAKTISTVNQQLVGQSRQFDAGRIALLQEADLLQEQILQVESRIRGTQSQLAAMNEKMALVKEERLNQEALLARGLTQATRVSDLKSEEATVRGQAGRLTADVAEMRGRIASIRIERLKLGTNRAKEAIALLRDIRYSEIELTQRRDQHLDTILGLEVRAPVDGIVYGSKVFALQSVVQPGAAMMYVIPQDQPFLIAAQVEAISIDQIHIGQNAVLRFPVFDQRETPELSGFVANISADVVADETTGLSYYAVDLHPDNGELERLGARALLPGMPVEIFIKTGDRTPFAFLTKPLTDYFRRAFRG